MARANAPSEVMAVVTTVAVAVVTKANTKAKGMKILRMTVPASRDGDFGRAVRRLLGRSADQQGNTTSVLTNQIKS